MMGVERDFAHEATRLALDRRLPGQVRQPRNAAAQAGVTVLLAEADADAPGAQRGGDRILVVAQAGDDPQPGDGDAPGQSLVISTLIALSSSSTQRL
jgi:hypothetical protein